MSAKTLTGTVVSTNMNKTVVVRIDVPKVHKRYNRRFIENRNIKAHNDDSEVNVGDRVLIASTKPISKTKSWILQEVLVKAI